MPTLTPLMVRTGGLKSRSLRKKRTKAIGVVLANVASLVAYQCSPGFPSHVSRSSSSVDRSAQTDLTIEHTATFSFPGQAASRPSKSHNNAPTRAAVSESSEQRDSYAIEIELTDEDIKNATKNFVSLDKHAGVKKPPPPLTPSRSTTENLVSSGSSATTCSEECGAATKPLVTAPGPSPTINDAPSVKTVNILENAEWLKEIVRNAVKSELNSTTLKSSRTPGTLHRSTTPNSTSADNKPAASLQLSESRFSCTGEPSAALPPQQQHQLPSLVPPSAPVLPLKTPEMSFTHPSATPAIVDSNTKSLLQPLSVPSGETRHYWTSVVEAPCHCHSSTLPPQCSAPSQASASLQTPAPIVKPAPSKANVQLEQSPATQLSRCASIALKHHIAKLNGLRSPTPCKLEKQVENALHFTKSGGMIVCAHSSPGRTNASLRGAVEYTLQNLPPAAFVFPKKGKTPESSPQEKQAAEPPIPVKPSEECKNPKSNTAPAPSRQTPSNRCSSRHSHKGYNMLRRLKKRHRRHRQRHAVKPQTERVHRKTIALSSF